VELVVLVVEVLELDLVEDQQLLQSMLPVAAAEGEEPHIQVQMVVPVVPVS
jgi:hypothetical protein